MVPIQINADQTSDDLVYANTQTTSDHTCNTAQANIDAASLNTLKTVVLNDLTTKQTTVANDAADQSNAKTACDLTLYGFIGNPALNPVPGDVGSCGRAKKTQDDAAYAALITAVASWNGKSCPNPNTAYAFTLAQDVAGLTKCTSDAQTQHDLNCIPASTVVQTQADSVASAKQALDDATAGAAYTQTTVLENNYTTPVCINTATTAYNNCLLTADSSATSANICIDDATINYNTAKNAAYSADMNAVGPADAQHQHDLLICNASQTRDDAIANATCAFTTSNDNNTKNTSEELAGNTLTQSKTTDLNQEAQASVNCSCQFAGNQNQITDCQAEKKAIQAANDDVAQGAYNTAAAEPPVSPVGAAYATCYNADTAATSTKQKSITTDNNTHSACTINADNTWNNIYLTQTAIYNVALAAAAAKFQSDKNACNGG